MEPEETITISLEEYKDLLSESRWANALMEAGVDCWEGIDIAMEIYEEYD